MKFRFMLRDWLWLVPVVALALLWRIDRQHAVSRLRTTIQENQGRIATAELQVSALENRLRSLQRELDKRNAPVAPAIDAVDDEKPYPQPRPPRPNEIPDAGGIDDASRTGH